MVQSIEPRRFLGRSPSVYPAQLDSPQSSHHRRFTVPAVPTQEHVFYPPAPASAPAPTHLSESVSYFPSHPPVSASPTRYASTGFSGPSPHENQRAVNMPVPVHSNTAPSMPYNESSPNTMYSPSHSQMSGGSQPSGTYPNWNSRACTTFVLPTLFVRIILNDLQPT